MLSGQRTDDGIDVELVHDEPHNTSTNQPTREERWLEVFQAIDEERNTSVRICQNRIKGLMENTNRMFKTNVFFCVCLLVGLSLCMVTLAVRFKHVYDQVEAFKVCKKDEWTEWKLDPLARHFGLYQSDEFSRTRCAITEYIPAKCPRLCTKESVRKKRDMKFLPKILQIIDNVLVDDLRQNKLYEDVLRTTLCAEVVTNFLNHT